MSFSDSAGTETATPGRLIPLWLLTLPPTSTSVRTSVSSTTLTQPDLAVVDEDRVTGMHVAGQPLVRRAGDADVAGDVAGRDRPLLPRRNVTGPSAESARRILRPWRSAKMPTRARWHVGRLAHEPVGLDVVLVAAVAHVEPRHPCRRTQLPDASRQPVSRTQVQTILALRTGDDPGEILSFQQRHARVGRRAAARWEGSARAGSWIR